MDRAGNNNSKDVSHTQKYKHHIICPFVDVSFDSSAMGFIWSIHRRQKLTKKPWEGAFKLT